MGSSNSKSNKKVNRSASSTEGSLQDTLHITSIGKNNKELDNYVVDLTKEISHGAFGTVYMGYKTSDKTSTVAVKKISYVKENLTSLHKEIEICYKLKGNNNIVQLFSNQNDTQNYWFIFEYCDEGELSHYLRDKDLDLPTRVKIMVECTNAVSFMHSFSPPIVHCDIKPANILLKSHGRNQFVVKLADFGQGKLYECVHGHLTMNTVKGTPLFMAPEMVKIWKNQGSISSGDIKYYPSIDTFSLGLVLHVLIQDLCDRAIVIPYTEQMLKKCKPTIFGQELNDAHVNNTVLPVLHIPELTDHYSIAIVTEVIALMTKYEATDRIQLFKAKDSLLHSYCYIIKEHVRAICMKETKEKRSQVKQFYNEQAELLKSTLKDDDRTSTWNDTLKYVRDININTGISQKVTGTLSAKKRRVPVSAKSRLSQSAKHIRKQNNPLCTVAIDIGNSYSCYAIRFGNKSNLYSSRFPSSVLTESGPTGRFLDCGLKAENLYNESTFSGRTYELYQNWQLKLFPAKYNMFECVAVSQNGQNRAIADIYHMMLEGIKNHVMSQSCMKDTSIDWINWVITVPSQWSGNAKNILTTAAEDAGLQGSKTILRPEAILHKCNEVSDPETWLHSSSKSRFPLSDGSVVAIIDVGGSTLDATWMNYHKHQKSDIIHTAIFEIQHKTRTIQAFTQLLLDIFEKRNILKYQEEHPRKWHDLLEKCSASLHKFTTTMQDVRIDLSQDLEKATTKSDKPTGLKLDRDNGILIITRQYLDVYFKPIIEEIIFLIKQELARAQVSELGNHQFIMTGGYSNSRYFQVIIQDNFSNTEHNVLFHKDGQNTLIQGALIQ